MATVTRIQIPKTVSGSYSFGPPGSTLQVAPIASPFSSQLDAAKAALLSGGQMRTTANQQAGAQINAALGASNASSAAEQKQFAELQNRAAGLAAALGQIGQPVADSTYAAYKGAADTMSSLGGGLVGQAATDWQNQQADARARVDAALGPGVGQVDSYSVPAAQNALQYGGVTLPGEGLANSALTQRALTQYGVAADVAQARTKMDDYIQQAKDALNQRAAERAAIIAQRPELFQQALQAQRDDNAKTQSGIDNLTSAAATWATNQKKSKHDWIIQQIAATHINPLTHQPVGGWAWTDNTHTTVAPWTSIVAARQNARRLNQSGQQISDAESHWQQQFDEGVKEFNRSANQRQQTINLQKETQNKPGAYDPSASAQAGIIVDSHFRPIVDAKGNTQKYKPAAGQKQSPMKAADRQTLISGLYGVAQALFSGQNPDGTAFAGTGGQAQDASQAVNYMANMGWFSSPTLKKYAIASLNAVYDQGAVASALQDAGLQGTKIIKQPGKFGIKAKVTP